MKGLFILPFAPFVGAAVVAMAYTPAETQQPRALVLPNWKKPQIPGVSALQQSITNKRAYRTAFRRFRSEVLAKAYCGGGETVVWTDTKLKVYHFTGAYSYGRTRLGGYMCEKDSVSAGFHAAGIKQDAPECCGKIAEQPKQ